MALTTQARSAKSAAKKQAAGAEDLRLTVYPGTSAALAELMRRGGYTTQAECMSTLLINLAAMPESESAAALKPPRHEITITPKVARQLEAAGMRQAARLDQDE